MWLERAVVGVGMRDNEGVNQRICDCESEGM